MPILRNGRWIPPLKGRHRKQIHQTRRKKDKQRVIGPQDPNHTSEDRAASGANRSADTDNRAHRT
jgi:hypothetical protein